MIATETLPQGWMSEDELAWLVETARDCGRVLEVGAWKGRSTLAMSAVVRHALWAVDNWQGVPDDRRQHLGYIRESAGNVGGAYHEFRANLAQQIADGLVIPLRMDSQEAARALASSRITFDFVFIDADHRYESVRRDIEAYRPLVAPGGVLAGHDYGHWPGVTRAVDELVPNRQRGPGHIWWVRP